MTNHGYEYRMNPIRKELGMKSFGTKHPSYKPFLNPIGGERELVKQFTIQYNNGSIIHNDDGPAVIWSDGSLEFFVNGFLHNDDGPALIENHKNFIRKQWYVSGVLHREDGPAVEHMNTNGTSYVEYHKEGKLHNEDGPAVVHPTGTKLWYKNGIIDRIDGPAIINMKGQEVIGNQWFVSNRDVTKTYRRWANKRKVDVDGENFGIFRMEYKIMGGKI